MKWWRDWWRKGLSSGVTLQGLLVELVYTKDLKSFAFNGLRVRVPQRLPLLNNLSGDLKCTAN